MTYFPTNMNSTTATSYTATYNAFPTSNAYTPTTTKTRHTPFSTYTQTIIILLLKTLLLLYS